MSADSQAAVDTYLTDYMAANDVAAAYNRISAPELRFYGIINFPAASYDGRWGNMVSVTGLNAAWRLWVDAQPWAVKLRYQVSPLNPAIASLVPDRMASGSDPDTAAPKVATRLPTIGHTPSPRSERRVAQVSVYAWFGDVNAANSSPGSGARTNGFRAWYDKNTPGTLMNILDPVNTTAVEIRALNTGEILGVLDLTAEDYYVKFEGVSLYAEPKDTNIVPGTIDMEHILGDGNGIVNRTMMNLLLLPANPAAAAGDPLSGLFASVSGVRWGSTGVGYEYTANPISPNDFPYLAEFGYTPITVLLKGNLIFEYEAGRLQDMKAKRSRKLSDPAPMSASQAARIMPRNYPKRHPPCSSTAARVSNAAPSTAAKPPGRTQQPRSKPAKGKGRSTKKKAAHGRGKGP